MSDCAGSTRTNIPPCPLPATAKLPPIRNASPPNIFFSVKPDSSAINSRMRSASSSSYVTAAIVRQDGDKRTALSVRIRGSFGGRERAVMSADDGLAYSSATPRLQYTNRAPAARSPQQMPPARPAPLQRARVQAAPRPPRGHGPPRPKTSSARRPLPFRSSCSPRSWPTQTAREACSSARQRSRRLRATVGPRAGAEHQTGGCEECTAERRQADSGPEDRRDLDADGDRRRHVTRAVRIHDDDRPLPRAELPSDRCRRSRGGRLPEELVGGPSRVGGPRMVHVRDLERIQFEVGRLGVRDPGEVCVDRGLPCDPDEYLLVAGHVEPDV